MEKRKLLLVDDEAGIRLTLGTILQMRGFEVKTAATVGEALTAIQEEQYDVLVSDLNIGQPYDGFMIASAMRRIQPKVATVMITGYPAFEDALASIRQQIDDYLIKPTDVEALVKCIEEKLQSRQQYRPGQQKRAIEVVHENRAHIIKRWLSMVTADQELGEISVTLQQRQGHLPQFLDALTAQVEAHETAVSKVAIKAAALHGENRLELGYSIPLVAREARFLGAVIFEVLQEYLLEIKISQLISDMAEIATSIHQQLEHSLRAFIDAGQQPNAA
jgi:DNA-binding NtrC family response regulator